MTTRTRFLSRWDEAGYLQDKVIRWLYGRTPSGPRARLFADRLERTLKEIKPGRQAIKAVECQALIAEARGDLRSAIRHRRREIALLTRLLALPEYADGAPGLDTDHSDVVDRFILLALLLRRDGQLSEAAAALDNGRSIASKHGFRFHGAALVKEIRAAARAAG